LDSLSDGMVGSAISSLLIAELTSIAGDRNHYGVNNKPVTVFIDEAAEVLNDPFVQLLNKGRGAGLRLTVATRALPILPRAPAARTRPLRCWRI
jgi:conjugal transfer pilus assembly protein TraD